MYSLLQLIVTNLFSLGQFETKVNNFDGKAAVL
uniref:Uncharacterized protein n=1 Tax=Cyanothece sp. (strain PCC 7425 / ATCC 29141) TaxID=395961 RepID=B8HPC0_CYAP4